MTQHYLVFAKAINGCAVAVFALFFMINEPIPPENYFMFSILLLNSMVLHYKRLDTLGEYVERFLKYIYKLILSPAVRDYEARENNYKEIISKLQKELRKEMIDRTSEDGTNGGNNETDKMLDRISKTSTVIGVSVDDLDFTITGDRLT